MANDFEVTTESLDTMAATLRSESNRIENALRTLEDRASALESSWDGTAREAYREAQADWSVKFEDMKAVLELIASTTEEIAGHYNDADDEAAALFD